MTTNPYASPVEAIEFGDRAEQEIHSVIRTFRILAIFSIAEALLFCIILGTSLAKSVDLGNLMFIAMHIAIIVVSIFYLGIAARMARRQLGVNNWARRLSLLLMLGFPLFPIGLFCIPVFSVAGVLCYRKVKRYYPDYCEVPQR